MSGDKFDSEKDQPSLILVDMAPAINSVIKVSMMGAKKYSPGNWKKVAKGQQRYKEALLRHLLDENDYDEESGMLHAAHMAWNALAYLWFVLKKKPLKNPSHDA